MTPRHHAWRHLIAAGVLCLGVLATRDARAQSAVPVANQVPLLFKILSTDKNLARHAGSTYPFALLYNSGDEASVEQRDGFRAALGEGKQVRGKAIMLVEYDLAKDPAGLGPFLKDKGVAALYATGGLSDKLELIKSAARSQQATSSAYNVADIEAGLSVGFELINNRPKIVINLGEATTEGSEFSAQILGLARVIR